MIVVFSPQSSWARKCSILKPVANLKTVLSIFIFQIIRHFGKLDRELSSVTLRSKVPGQKINPITPFPSKNRWPWLFFHTLVRSESIPRILIHHEVFKGLNGPSCNMDGVDKMIFMTFCWSKSVLSTKFVTNMDVTSLKWWG